MANNISTIPKDALARRAIEPVICYPDTELTPPDLDLYRCARSAATKIDEVLVQPRDGACFRAAAGQFFRISSVEGAQVGDFNLWAADNLNERFYSGKTRALHGTHITVGERMWSTLPYLRPMATIIEDTLDWYGIDDFGGSVHDVIGTRCDPYTSNLLSGGHYHFAATPIFHAPWQPRQACRLFCNLVRIPVRRAQLGKSSFLLSFQTLMNVVRGARNVCK